MEAITQRQDDVLPAIPRTDERRAFECQEPQGAGKRLRVARDLHDEGDAVCATLGRRAASTASGWTATTPRSAASRRRHGRGSTAMTCAPARCRSTLVSRPTTPRPLTTTVSSNTGPRPA